MCSMRRPAPGLRAFAMAAAAALVTSAAGAQSPALLVVNKAENSLVVVDPARGKIGTRVPTGDGPHEVALAPDGRTAFVTNYGAQALGSSLWVIDIATKRSNRLRFTPDGRLVLVSDLDAGDVVVIDVPTRTPVKRIPLGRGPSGILVVPGGTRAYVALTGENALAVLDLKTLEPAGRLATGAGPDGMAWVASGQK